MTLFNRSLREPDSWSAAARRNFSVFVAAGRIADVVSSKGLEGAAAVVRTEGRDEDWSGRGG